MELVELLILCFFLVLGLYGLDAYRREQRRRFILKERMPKELQSARLALSESYISTDAPRKMHGALDQLYRLTEGVHVLVDTKTRHQQRVYRKDIVQLSVYSIILRRNGYKVADYGYVRAVSPEGINYIKTPLLNDEETVWEYDRTEQVLSKKVTPMAAEHKGMCASCPQQINCDQWRFASSQ